jgi:hypothetical protein
MTGPLDAPGALRFASAPPPGLLGRLLREDEQERRSRLLLLDDRGTLAFGVDARELARAAEAAASDESRTRRAAGRRYRVQAKDVMSRVVIRAAP